MTASPVCRLGELPVPVPAPASPVGVEAPALPPPTTVMAVTVLWLPLGRVVTCTAVLVTEVWLTLLAEEDGVVEDSLLLEDEDGSDVVLDTLNEVREAVEENSVEETVDVGAMDDVEGGKTEPRVDPCEIGATGVATDGEADTELLLTPPS